MCYLTITWIRFVVMNWDWYFSEKTSETSMYEDVKEAKNANVIGTLALILVICEVAFVLLLDSRQLKGAYYKFKKNFCNERKKRRI